MTPAYDADQVAAALRASGVEAGRTVFCHSNIGFFGLPAGARTAENACATILAGFRAALGAAGTLVVPTFTYSFSTGKPFAVAATPSNCGIFAEHVRCRPEARRSRDPNISVAALGPDAEALTRAVPENAYGEGCFWERFLAADGLVCNLNFDAGSTFIHYVERQLRVPYRFDKTFAGTFIEGDGARIPGQATIWVRQLSDPDLVAAFEPFSELAVRSGAFTTATLGRGTVGAISARRTAALIRAELPRSPWLLTRAQRSGRVPALPVA
jgi:aminoglycoside 3-N-acetyltransferase